jgi:hypothetical protein
MKAVMSKAEPDDLVSYGLHSTKEHDRSIAYHYIQSYCGNKQDKKVAILILCSHSLSPNLRSKQRFLKVNVSSEDPFWVCFSAFVLAVGWQQSKPLLQQVPLASILVIWGEASCRKRTIHYILLMPIRTC